MHRREAVLLLTLASIWGSSFLFIKLGVDELEPSVVVLGRLVVGVAVLVPVVLAARRDPGPARDVVPCVVLGALNNAVPFWLLGFAETRLDSGLTAVIQAAAPIFTVVLASRIDPSQRVTRPAARRRRGRLRRRRAARRRAGGEPARRCARSARDGHCYAVSVLYAGRTVRSFPPLEVSIGQLGVGMLLALPFGLTQLPSEAPPAKAVAAIVALGALGSGVAYLLYFTLIARAGASRAILVTYLVPAFALVYGTVFLDEPVTVSALVGLVLILGGTALGTGMRLRRRG